MMTQPSDMLSTNFTQYQVMRQEAVQSQRKALPKVAKQFESLFIHQMLKSMRQANQFFAKDNPLSSKDVKFYEQMLDQEMSIKLANGKGIGLAESLIRQLEQNLPKDQLEQSGMPVKGLHDSSASVKATIPIAEKAADVDIAKASKVMNYADKKSFSSVEDFVKTLWPYAKEAAKSLAVDPKVLIAQVALETGWGKSVIEDKEGQSSFNLFNIKQGSKDSDDAVSIKTSEFINGVEEKVVAPFRRYLSFSESFDDYVSLVKNNPRYQQAESATSDPKSYITELHNAGYATDPNYAKKIMTIFDSKTLSDAVAKAEELR